MHVPVKRKEGEYEIEGTVYGAGTYQLFPPGDTHGPFASKNGAVVLVIWDPLRQGGVEK